MKCWVKFAFWRWNLRNWGWFSLDFSVKISESHSVGVSQCVLWFILLPTASVLPDFNAIRSNIQNATWQPSNPAPYCKTGYAVQRMASVFFQSSFCQQLSGHYVALSLDSQSLYQLRTARPQEHQFVRPRSQSHRTTRGVLTFKFLTSLARVLVRF